MLVKVGARDHADTANLLAVGDIDPVTLLHLMIEAPQLSGLTAHEARVVLGPGLGDRPLEGIDALVGLEPTDDVREIAEHLPADGDHLAATHLLPVLARAAGPNAPVVHGWAVDPVERRAEVAHERGGIAPLANGVKQRNEVTRRGVEAGVARLDACADQDMVLVLGRVEVVEAAGNHSARVL